MPPQLAFGLTILLVGYLIRRDSRESPRPSTAIWIPTLWLLLSGSRQPSQWLDLRSGTLGQGLSEGSQFDQVVFGALIVAGIFVIRNRHVRFDQIAKNSSWIILFFLYEGISVVWSDFPFIAFKRWIKASGDFVMVFVLISDPYPVRAIIALLKRSGYVLIPISVVLCKYYPEMARAYDDWGRSAYTGVTLDKNMFGYLLFAYGVFFAAALVTAYRQDWPSRAVRRIELAIPALLLIMVFWLTPIANSKTSLFAMLSGIAVVIALQFSQIKRHLWSFLIATALVAAVANALFSVGDAVLEAAGRDASLTGRTGIWKTVLSEPFNPIVGTGYASYWLGERLEHIWSLDARTKLLQAHNGYIEVFINLGLVGVILLAGVLWTGLRNARRRSLTASHDPEPLHERLYQTFGIAYICAYLIYNITEATFMGLNFLFIIFLVLAFESTRTRVDESASYLEEGDAPEGRHGLEDEQVEAI